MKIIIVRWREEGNTYCSLLSGSQCKGGRKAWEAAMPGCAVLLWWVVPRELSNACASGNLNDAFKALINLDVLAETPMVSDLLATIFEAGFQAGRKNRD